MSLDWMIFKSWRNMKIKHKYGEDIGEFGDAGATTQYFYLSDKDKTNQFYPSVLRHSINFFEKYQKLPLQKFDQTKCNCDILFLFKNKRPVSYINLPKEMSQFDMTAMYLETHAPFFLKEKYESVFSKYVLKTYNFI